MSRSARRQRPRARPRAGTPPGGAHRRARLRAGARLQSWRETLDQALRTVGKLRNACRTWALLVYPARQPGRVTIYSVAAGSIVDERSLRPGELSPDAALELVDRLYAAAPPAPPLPADTIDEILLVSSWLRATARPSTSSICRPPTRPPGCARPRPTSSFAGCACAPARPPQRPHRPTRRPLAVDGDRRPDRPGRRPRPSTARGAPFATVALTRTYVRLTLPPARPHAAAPERETKYTWPRACPPPSPSTGAR